mgnify:CR=1 FL=1
MFDGGGRAISDEDASAVLAANQRFYEAFEAEDLDAMSDVWEHSERAVCNHPGWARLRGWPAIAGSWYALFQNPQRLQFVLTDVEVVVEGDVGWVTLDENLLDRDVAGTVSAVNIFDRSGGEWRLVAHFGSAVMARGPAGSGQ